MIGIIIGIIIGIFIGLLITTFTPPVVWIIVVIFTSISLIMDVFGKKNKL